MSLKNDYVFRYKLLDNSRGKKESKETNSVVLPFDFIQKVLKLDERYSEQHFIQYRDKHKLNSNHVTKSTLQVIMAIGRTFNNLGELAGVSIHRLYEVANKEYEGGCSKEQFYAEFHKLLQHGIIKKVEEYNLVKFFIDPDLMSKRYIVFSPAVFTQQFNKLSLAAQKLYIYLLTRIKATSNKRTFVEHFYDKDSYLYLLTRRTKPSHIKGLIEELKKCVVFDNCPLLEKGSIEYYEGRMEYRLDVMLHTKYVIPHKAGWKYREVLEAKLPYNTAFTRFKAYLMRSDLYKFFMSESYLDKMALIRLLHNKGKQIYEFVMLRLAQMRKTSLSLRQMVKQLKLDLQLKSFPKIIEGLTQNGIIEKLAALTPDNLYSDLYLLAEVAEEQEDPLAFIHNTLTPNLVRKYEESKAKDFIVFIQPFLPLYHNK